MLKKAVATFILVLAAGSLSSVHAEPISATVLAQCLLDAAGEEDETKMKNFLINALQENKEETQKALLDVGMLVAQRSMLTCGADLKDLESPAFEKAAEMYGETMGERIMVKTMSNLGLE